MKPIITSILDLDLYKLTMCYAAWKLYPNYNVTYTFFNRSKTNIFNYVPQDEVEYQIRNILSLKFTFNDLQYLNSLNLFDSEFLTFLICNVGDSDNIVTFTEYQSIEFTGKWPIAILYETMILSSMNELYTSKISDTINTKILDNLMSDSMEKLHSKLKKLSRENIPFIEFGTRRRFSKDWQEKVLRTILQYDNDAFIGTSNVELAKHYNIKPIGTVAHEWFMVLAAKKLSLAQDKFVQQEIIEEWLSVFPNSIVLTDTFGTKNFFEIFNHELASRCSGIRQDSGDPFDFAEKAIEHYEKLGIDPKTKQLVFSDNLDVDLTLALWSMFNSKIIVSFGIGTNLTNDTFIKPLNIVVKATSVDGYETVKLSDNIEKATGSKRFIELYQEIFR